MLRESKCPIAKFLDLFGDKWSLIILRDMFMGKKTFNDFLTSQEGIASNILTNRLKFLSNSGFVKFKLNPLNKKVKWYYLTDKAVDCYPVILEMMKWSGKHLSVDFGDVSKILEEIKNNSSDKISTKVILKYKSERENLISESLNSIQV